MAISGKVERIIHAVEALSATERHELMRALGLADLDRTSADWGDDHQSKVQDTDDGNAPLMFHEEMSLEWSREIQRRAREIDDGNVQLVEEDEFLSKLRAL